MPTTYYTMRALKRIKSDGVERVPGDVASQDFAVDGPTRDLLVSLGVASLLGTASAAPAVIKPLTGLQAKFVDGLIVGLQDSNGMDVVTFGGASSGAPATYASVADLNSAPAAIAASDGAAAIVSGDGMYDKVGGVWIRRTSRRGTKWRNISTGLTLNTGLVGVTVNTTTNVETFSPNNNWRRGRKKVQVVADVPAGQPILIRVPLFYTKFNGAASANDRAIYDKMLENPLFIQAALQPTYENANAGLLVANTLPGTVNGSTDFTYNPATYNGKPYVDFMVVLDRDLIAGQFVGVKLYMEDTNGVSLQFRLPQGKSITKSSTIDNFEYCIGSSPGTNNSNARGVIFTETSFVQASSDATSQNAFGAVEILAMVDIDSWAGSMDSIGEAVYDERTSNGTSMVLADSRGDFNGNNGWPAVFVGTKLRKPFLNLGRGSDTVRYHAPSFFAASPVLSALPAYPSGTVPCGNYLRAQLMADSGITHILDQCGTNDVAGSVPFATFMGYKLEELNFILSKFTERPRIYSCLILPKGKPADASANGLPSPLGQTHESYNRGLVTGNGSVRAQYARALMSGKSGLPIAGYIDPCRSCENDPINSDGLWRSVDSTFLYQFSEDSTHPHRLGADIIGRGAEMHSMQSYAKTMDGRAAVEIMLNLNSTANQVIYINPLVRAFKVRRIVAWGATTGTALVNLAASPAQVAIYGDAASTIVIAAAQTITGLTDLTKLVELALNGAGAGNVFTGNLYLKLSTAHGSAAYFNLAVDIDVLA